MIEEIVKYMLNEGLYICLTVVLVNVIIALSVPIISSYYPQPVKNLTHNINNVVAVNRMYLFSSSLLLIGVVFATIFAYPVLKHSLSSYSKQSVLNLTNLSK